MSNTNELPSADPGFCQGGWLGHAPQKIFKIESARLA